MSGVDARQVEFHRLAPRAADIVGIDHIVGSGSGIVNIVTSFVLHQVWGVYRTVEGMECTGYGCPVHQVGRMPDEQSRCIIKR